MIGTILFATDLGPFTSQVLQHVITMAEKNSAKVCVLHVVDPVSALTHNLLSRSLEAPHKHKANYARIMNECIRDQVMETLEDEYLDGNSALDSVNDVSVLTGLPSETILAHAKKLGADLIVLGSHSHSYCQKEGSKLGSVASKVLHRSDIPVYLVPLMKSERIQSACSTQPQQ